MRTETRGAKPGDRRAAKNPEDAKLSRLVMRCKQSDKASWVRAANGKKQKLAAWVTDHLNEAANTQPD